MEEKIGILGAGGWGTALSLLLQKKGYKIFLWEVFPEYAELLKKKRENINYFPGFKIPEEIFITHLIEKVLVNSEILILVVPSLYFKSTLKKIKQFYGGQPLLIATKGLDLKTGKRMSELLEEVLGEIPFGVLSGPTIAREITHRQPAAAVVASRSLKLAEKFQKLLSCDYFRLYTNKDIIGVELGGALKNIIAIGAGIIDGLKLGTNTKASYITRGLNEMVKVGVSLGGEEKTFWGLSGIGDLITTCFSRYSRNRSFGQAIVEVGKEKYLRKTKMAIEGIPTTKSLYEMKDRIQVELPITETIYRIIYLNDKKHREEIKNLMRRKLKKE